MYPINVAGEIIFKHAQKAEFFLQNIGENYKLKFHVLHTKIMPNYLVNQTIKDGSDLCMAIGVVDKEDPNYSDEAMEDLNIPEQLTIE